MTNVETDFPAVDSATLPSALHVALRELSGNYGRVDTAPVPTSDELDELDALLTEHGITEERHIHNALHQYHQFRRPSAQPRAVLSWQVALPAWRPSSLNRFLNAWLHESDDCRQYRAFDTRILASKDVTEGVSLLLWRDRAQEGVAGLDTVYKTEPAATVGRATWGDKRYCVKFYHLKKPHHLLSRGIRRSLALHAWVGAHILRFYGFDTPAPVAMVEHRIGPLTRSAMLVTEHLDGPDLLEFLQNRNVDSAAKDRAIDEVARVHASLYHKYLVHGDFKLGNCIIQGGRLYRVDLDGLRRYRTKRRLDAMTARDIGRVLRSLRDQPALCEAFEAAFARWLGNTMVQAARDRYPLNHPERPS